LLKRGGIKKHCEPVVFGVVLPLPSMFLDIGSWQTMSFQPKAKSNAPCPLDPEESIDCPLRFRSSLLPPIAIFGLGSAFALMAGIAFFWRTVLYGVPCCPRRKTFFCPRKRASELECPWIAATNINKPLVLVVVGW